MGTKSPHKVLNADMLSLGQARGEAGPADIRQIATAHGPAKTGVVPHLTLPAAPPAKELRTGMTVRIRVSQISRLSDISHKTGHTKQLLLDMAIDHLVSVAEANGI